MTSICSSQPAVNNGKVLSSTSTSAEYECLSGFQLEGTKVVFCDTTSGWGTTPTCNVINNSDSILTWGPEWFLVLLAVIIILLFISCVGCIIWNCCFRRREEGFLCFGKGESGGRGRGPADYSEDSQLVYNESAGVYTMADGTMFIPVRPYNKGMYGKGGFHHQPVEEAEPGIFDCFRGNKNRKQRPSADMVFDESKGVYILKDGTMYTPIKPRTSDKDAIWRNQADINSKDWYVHRGVYAGEINGTKDRKYDPNDVQKYSAADFNSDKQNGHWFLDNNNHSINNNRTTVKTSLQEPVQKPTTVYIVENDSRIKKDKEIVIKKPSTPKPIIVQSTRSSKPVQKPTTVYIIDNDKRQNKGKNVDVIKNPETPKPVFVQSPRSPEPVQKPTKVYIIDNDIQVENKKDVEVAKFPEVSTPVIVQTSPAPTAPPPEQFEFIRVKAKHQNVDDDDNIFDSKKNEKELTENKDKEDANAKMAARPEEETKPTKSKQDKIVIINFNHRGRSRSKNVETDKHNIKDATEEEKIKVLSKQDNELSKSLPLSRLYTPSESGTRDTFSLADVEDLIASEIQHDSGMDRSTDDDEPIRLNADDKFVDEVRRDLILEKMRQKKRNDKVWIPHSHPIRNKKHFTK